MNRGFNMENDLKTAGVVCLFFALCLLVGFLCSGCATWQDRTQQSINTAFASIKAASQIGEQIFREKCVGVARDECSGHRKVCQKLIDCWAERSKFNRGIIAAHYAVLDTQMAMHIVSQKETDSLVIDLLQMVAKISAQLKELGWFPKLSLPSASLP